MPPSNLIYGDWDVYFIWFPCVTEYYFSSVCFFFLLIFTTCKCKNHSWLTHHTKAGGGLDWALEVELADSWAIVSEKRGWWGEMVFTLLLAGDVFRNGTRRQWRHPALVKERRARRLLLSLFLPLSLLPPTPKATSGYGNQAALEIQRLDFSQSSTPTPSTMQVMGAH